MAFKKVTVENLDRFIKDYNKLQKKVELLTKEADNAVKVIEEFVDLDDNEYTSTTQWANFREWFYLYTKRLDSQQKKKEGS